jgi:hypothetical protein
MLTSIKQNQQQRGALFIEAAFVLPVLLLIIASIIDFSKVLYDHLLIREVHYAIGREVALFDDPCRPQAELESKFKAKLEKLGLHGRMVTVSPDSTTHDFLDLTINGAAIRVNGLNLQVEVESRCLFCGMFSAIKDGLNYKAGGFFPYETNKSCS